MRPVDTATETSEVLVVHPSWGDGAESRYGYMTHRWGRTFRYWPRCSSALLITVVLVAGCSDPTRAAFCGGELGLEIWGTDLEGNVERITDSEGGNGFVDWSPDGRRIAFVSSRDGNCEVYVMLPDGTEPVNLTNSRSDELYPSWSPDGTEIVFSSDGQLHVVDVGSRERRQVTESHLIHAFPDWSPDGETVVFSGGTEAAGPGVIHQIYLVPIVGGQEIALTDQRSLLAAPRWSPDGSQIAFFDHADPFQVWVMNRDGSDPRAIAKGGHLSWSPDGSSLVYDREVEAGDVDLFVDGVLVVDGPGVDTLPAWSPDGTTIVFSSDRP
jgi:Tol biopolymer transport system component